MKEVFAYVHTHWDREWYREFEEFRLRLIEVFDEIIEMLEKNELPVFYFDGQCAALEDYLEIFPEKTNKIKKLVKEKKLRTGPFYCSADSFLCSGESLFRNFETGMKIAESFGETDFIGYLCDTFGHSSRVPAVLKALNITKACIWRGVENLPADLSWEGIDTVNLIQGYFQDFLHSNSSVEKKAEGLKKYLDKISEKSGHYVLLPIGADHLAAAKNLNKQVEELNNIFPDYNIKITSPFEYFDKMTERKQVSGEFLDNTLTFILPGVYSSRIYLKQKNAKVQFLLSRIAEPLQALFHHFYVTKNKQNEIDYAFKTLIKNHAHDSIYGCSTDKVHGEVMQRYANVQTVAEGVIKRILRDISADTDTPSVVNLSSFPYSGKILIKTEKTLPSFLNAVKISSKKGFTDKKLYDINEIPVTEDITDINEYIINVKNLAPFSITKITENNICTENFLKTSDNSIENNFIKFEIRNNKVFATDKIKNEKYSDFIEITDRADIGDSYNFAPLSNDKPINAKLKSFKLKESNIQRAILELIYEIKLPENSSEKGRSKKLQNHKLKIDAILYNNNEFIEFKTKWNNKSKNHILQIGFNLKDKITETLSEDLFGTVKRTFKPDFDIYKLIPAPRGKEIKPNTAPMQRFVQCQNFALFTKGNIEYEIVKNTLFLTLLRATGIISEPKNTSRGTPAGPPLPTPELQCLGENKARFAFAFTDEEIKLFGLADEFYSPYEACFSNCPDKKFLQIDNENILVYSIQYRENHLKLRLFNNSQKKEKTTISTQNTSKTIEFEPGEIKNTVIF